VIFPAFGEDQVAFGAFRLTRLKTLVESALNWKAIPSRIRNSRCRLISMSRYPGARRKSRGVLPSAPPGPIPPRLTRTISDKGCLVEPGCGCNRTRSGIVARQIERLQQNCANHNIRATRLIHNARPEKVIPLTKTSKPFRQSSPAKVRPPVDHHARRLARRMRVNDLD